MPTPPDDLYNSNVHATNVDESLQFLWAVSYSDLMMVLLTFFIVFYHYSDALKGSPLDRVVLNLKNKALPVSATSVPQRNITYLPLDEIRQKLGKTETGKTTFNYRDGLLINLSDNVYDAAKFTVNPVVMSELQQILDAIKPLAGSVALTFIGHTDEKPLIRVGNSVIDSNLVLSNLRAAKAVEFAVGRGFDPRWVSAQGVGEYSRNSRSLSVQIVDRTRP
jgi:flagellar motor protein MotB